MASETETKDQFAKFVESAREHECDEDEVKFEDQVRKIASAPRPETKEGHE